jgi:hypothetical protein
MRRSNLGPLLYLLLVFVSGAVVGGFANRLYMMNTVRAGSPGGRNRADFRKQYVEEMRTRLHLTDPQVAELQQIMEATGQHFHELHKSIEQEHVRKVTAILTDDQKAEYAKMREERDRRRQRTP